MSKRLYWICRMCEHQHRAASAGAYADGGPGCGQACHGPIAGGWFPAYRGVLRNGTDSAGRWCVFCGDPAVAAARVADHFLGVCMTHENHLRVRVRRDGGTVTDVYQDEGKAVWGCDDRELRNG